MQRIWFHPKNPGECFSLLTETWNSTKFVIRYCATGSFRFSSTCLVPDTTRSSTPLPRNVALEAIKEAGWKQLEDTTLLVAKKAQKSLFLMEDQESKPNVKQLRLASRLLDMLEDIVYDYCIRVAELCDADGEPMIEVGT